MEDSLANVLVSTVPFASHDILPLQLLDSVGAHVTINPIGRRLQEEELAELIPATEILIAGTEPITRKVMEAAPNLRLIARVGIGLDNVDLLAARERGIQVTYTPEAPAPAVAELTVGLMVSLLRHTHTANALLHDGQWHRFMGRRIGESTIGVIGVGRIGSRVIQLLSSFGVQRFIAHDVAPQIGSLQGIDVELVGQDEVFREADIVTLHVPLTPDTRNMVGRAQLDLMKADAVLINTSRGGVVEEEALLHALQSGRLGGAAVDVFAHEPYEGPLTQESRCLLTSHMGSMSIDCRSRMELEATREAVRFLTGESTLCPVPEQEYLIQAQAGSSTR
ncbi:phosphoglycerate dehydrogenase [bacterium]|nr:phosphoglycerate dehydrogenase [bacterium]